MAKLGSTAGHCSVKCEGCGHISDYLSQAKAHLGFCAGFEWTEMSRLSLAARKLKKEFELGHRLVLDARKEKDREQRQTDPEGHRLALDAINAKNRKKRETDPEGHRLALDARKGAFQNPKKSRKYRAKIKNSMTEEETAADRAKKAAKKGNSGAVRRHAKMRRRRRGQRPVQRRGQRQKTQEMEGSESI